MYIRLEFDEADKPFQMGKVQTFEDQNHFDSWRTQHSTDTNIIPGAELVDDGKRMRFLKPDGEHGFASISLTD